MCSAYSQNSAKNVYFPKATDENADNVNMSGYMNWVWWNDSLHLRVLLELVDWAVLVTLAAYIFFIGRGEGQ